VDCPLVDVYKRIPKLKSAPSGHFLVKKALKNPDVCGLLKEIKDRYCLDTRFNGKFDAVAVDFVNNKLDKKFRKIKDEYR